MTVSPKILRVGYASADITPAPGITLSGFASRCNQPSTGIDDRLSVHAIAFEHENESALLLVFDLLGLGAELKGEIESAVHAAAPDARPILCCTHTHSGPATVELIGCGIFDRAYWDLVVRAAAQAARDAIQSLRPAMLRYTTRDVGGISYNRRHVLANGRVVMTVAPEDRVVKIGPTWDEMFLARFDDAATNAPIVGLCAWAAHPVVVCTQNISADFPGELRRRLSQRCGFPFVYLQGACANINLPFTNMTRPEMLAVADRIMAKIGEIPWDRPATATPLHLSREMIKLRYQPMSPLHELRALTDGMATTAATGRIDADVALALANILNLKPKTTPDEKIRHIAAAVAEWSRRWLDRGDCVPRDCDLAIATLELGDLVFPIVAGEMFCETGLKLRDAFPNRHVVPIAYASPLVGYLPTDESIDEGGYEAAQAFRFFGAPAPFAPGTETQLIQALRAGAFKSERGKSSL